MSDATPFVSDADFEKEVLKSSEPVVVDFYAEWCGPCKAMSPALEAVANDLKGKVKVVKLDVDQNPSTTAKYDIRAMPTMRPRMVARTMPATEIMSVLRAPTRSASPYESWGE